ncbi:MAG: hypothetical protein KDH94_06370, partial [Coxiellaceae bacterium]|nr:hypothetical protein [Coxiellaceae bacterium]
MQQRQDKKIQRVSANSWLDGVFIYDYLRLTYQDSHPHVLLVPMVQLSSIRAYVHDFYQDAIVNGREITDIIVPYYAHDHLSFIHYQRPTDAKQQAIVTGYDSLANPMPQALIAEIHAMDSSAIVHPRGITQPQQVDGVNCGV